LKKKNGYVMRARFRTSAGQKYIYRSSHNPFMSWCDL